MARIWNGTVVRTDDGIKGVVISQTQNPDYVVVRYEFPYGEWDERVSDLTVLDEHPIIDGTRTAPSERGLTTS
jgi:hypothetical protein